MDDGTHKCVKSNTKCSPDYCNFKGSCELKSVSGKDVPICTCKSIYAGRTCNKCKDKNMQFPGCHTHKSKQLISETLTNKAQKSISSQNRLKQKCMRPIPPSFDTYEDLKYNGQAKLSGIYSLSEINNKISLGSLTRKNKSYMDCLMGQGAVNIRVYVEYIEESYVNQRIPITISETKGSDVSNIAQSSAIYLPGLDSDTQMVRGEYIEATVTNTVDLTTSITKNIEFDLEDVLEAQSVQMNNG